MIRETDLTSEFDGKLSNIEDKHIQTQAQPKSKKFKKIGCNMLTVLNSPQISSQLLNKINNNLNYTLGLFIMYFILT